jgi:hypothetical protein
VIITERKLLGVLPYKIVFFPSESVMAEIAEGLGPGHLARFFWTPMEFEPSGRVIQHECTATVCINLRNPLEELWGAISKNGRNEMRNAERLGGRVRIARNGVSARQDFLAVYNTFARAKTGVSPLTQKYVDDADVFVAYLDERPMCSHAYLTDTSLGRVRLLYSASRRLEDREMGRLCSNLNRLLHWREICAYHEDGFVTYDLGGIREDRNDGIARFKTSFGGEVCREHTYLCFGSPWLGVATRGLLQTIRRFRSRAVAETRNPSPETRQQGSDAA